jgi:hypothetical protein
MNIFTTVPVKVGCYSRAVVALCRLAHTHTHTHGIALLAQEASVGLCSRYDNFEP